MRVTFENDGRSVKAMGVVIGDGEKVIAEETVYVKDPETGVVRQVFAGDEVPQKLIAGYRAATSKGTSSSGASDDLGAKSRGELNTIAEGEGVENVGDLRTKDEVIEAIKAARGE